MEKRRIIGKGEGEEFSFLASFPSPKKALRLFGTKVKEESVKFSARHNLPPFKMKYKRLLWLRIVSAVFFISREQRVYLRAIYGATL